MNLDADQASFIESQSRCHCDCATIALKVLTILVLASCPQISDISKAEAQQLRRYTATEAVKIGGADAPEFATFSWLPRLILGSDGSIYALISTESRIVVFDSTGRFIRQIGRQGEGPGEMISPVGHGFLSDTIWVASGPGLRLTRFRIDGTHLESRSLRYPAIQTPKLGGPQNITALLQDGHALYIPGSVLIEPPGRVSLPVLIGPTDMRSVDTVAFVSRPEGLLLRGVGMLWYYPFQAPPLIAVSSDGSGLTVVGWSDVPNSVLSVRRLDSRGQELWDRQIPLPSRKIPGRVRDSVITIAVNRSRPYVDAERKRQNDVKLVPSIKTLVEEGLVLPNHYPPATALVAGSDGTTWIRTATPDKDDIWLVLNPSGVPEFQVAVPAGVKIQQATRSSAWGTTTDTDGVHYVVKLVVK